MSLSFSFPPRCQPGGTSGFLGEMRGERHCGALFVVGRSDDELLSSDGEELSSQSTLPPVELRLRQTGTPGNVYCVSHCLLLHEANCRLLLYLLMAFVPMCF